MNYEVVFATVDAEEDLRAIFLDSNMDIAGDIHDHVLIKKDDEIVAGGMMSQVDKDVFHLLVFAVKKSARKLGVGCFLINKLIEHPWRYCKDGSIEDAKCYRVTTVSKGESAEFYKKAGFVVCNFSELAHPFCEQCKECPDISDCNPTAMVYVGSDLQSSKKSTVVDNSKQ